MINTGTAPDHLTEIIHKAIASEVERITKEEATEAAKRVEKRVREQTAFICANVCSKMSFERFGPEIVVTLRIEPKTLAVV